MKNKSLIAILVLTLALTLTACKKDDTETKTEIKPDTLKEVSTISGDIATLIASGDVNINAPYQEFIKSEFAEAYVGLTQAEYETNIEEGIFCESMMSPDNQSYCLLKVKSSADVESLQEKVFQNANPRKWICVKADSVLVMANDSYIMLAMGPEEATSSLKVAFAEFAGDTLKEEMYKSTNIK